MVSSHVFCTVAVFHSSLLIVIPVSHSEPIFIDAHLIPDGSDPNDAKLYFFFRERLTDNSGNTKNIHTMVARVCPVSAFWPCLNEPVLLWFVALL